MARIADRNITKIINEICTEENINIKTFSSDWIIKLTKDGVTKHIVGYEFELNSIATNLILKDKSAFYLLLNDDNIKCVENKLFVSPKNIEHLPETGNWNNILNYFKENNGDIIAKPNGGTGGDNVLHIKDLNKLENAIYKLFRKYSNIVLSPYYEIDNEYRAIFLDGKVELCYKKNNLFVIGNGKNTLLELIRNKYKSKTMESILKDMDSELLPRLDEIIEINHKINVNWKFNLGNGSLPSLDITDEEMANIMPLVENVTKSLNIRFASIDIIRCKNEYFVLEANGGVMMEYFSRLSEENYEIAKGIYKRAMLKMFE